MIRSLSREEQVFVLAGVVAIILSIVGVIMLCQPVKIDPPMLDDEQNGFGSAMPEQTGFQTITTGRHFKIQWDADSFRGARPLDAINATIARIQYEQDTDELSSNVNAQALAYLMQARQTLEGKQTVTEDGLPILE
jgi:hypothetical protein